MNEAATAMLGTVKRARLIQALLRSVSEASVSVREDGVVGIYHYSVSLDLLNAPILLLTGFPTIMISAAYMPDEEDKHAAEGTQEMNVIVEALERFKGQEQSGALKCKTSGGVE